ncbi:uncharacterized protein [Rutidosis leptorrhynchoides]|uniref:uncharacterized protein n=1 Tax=Rutidosis leptorrhynchoides TaxID=125765 RepID=UPI003A998499
MEGSKWLVKWNWVREVSGRARNELCELSGLLSSFGLSPDQRDRWAWSPGSKGCFTANRLSSLLDERLMPTTNSSAVTLRNNFIPKKVELFVWRTRKGRLPILPELDKRGIDLNSVRCPICDDDIESLDHSLFACKISKEIWVRVFNWWNMGNITSHGIRDLLIGDVGQNVTEVGKLIWQGVIWTGCYLIWKNRNEKVFKNKCWNVPVAVSEIQVKSFDWIAKRCKAKDIVWLDWLHNPWSYLI